MLLGAGDPSGEVFLNNLHFRTIRDLVHRNARGLAFHDETNSALREGGNIGDVVNRSPTGFGKVRGDVGPV